MKTIAIIGGMGPQASIHAHKRLVEKLIENKLKANIIHVSLVTEHFFNDKVKFNFSLEQKDLLWPY